MQKSYDKSLLWLWMIQLMAQWVVFQIAVHTC